MPVLTLVTGMKGMQERQQGWGGWVEQWNIVRPKHFQMSVSHAMKWMAQRKETLTWSWNWHQEWMCCKIMKLLPQKRLVQHHDHVCLIITGSIVPKNRCWLWQCCTSSSVCTTHCTLLHISILVLWRITRNTVAGKGKSSDFFLGETGASVHSSADGLNKCSRWLKTAMSHCACLFNGTVRDIANSCPVSLGKILSSGGKMVALRHSSWDLKSFPDQSWQTSKGQRC